MRVYSKWAVTVTSFSTVNRSMGSLAMSARTPDQWLNWTFANCSPLPLGEGQGVRAW